LTPGEAVVGFGRSRARGRDLERLPLVRQPARLVVVASPDELPPPAAAGDERPLSRRLALAAAPGREVAA
jgi:hypothetical protein